MPNLKYSEKFYWLIHKQDDSLTIGMSEGTNPIEIHMLGTEEPQPITWVATHFHIIPLGIPHQIINFESPQAGTMIPKGNPNA